MTDSKQTTKTHNKKTKQIHLADGTIHIFTDGSSSRVSVGGKGPGGWGAVLLYKDAYKELFGGNAKTTNNEMELSGVYYGLAALKTKTKPVIVYSDSQYAINALTRWWRGWKHRGWKTADGSPVKNLELIQKILPLITDNVRFKWVKGHSGLTHNERADVLAGMGKKQHCKGRKKPE